MVAVILLNWNSYGDTTACIESIITNDPNWIIYVVDNASDNEEAKLLTDKFSSIRVLPQSSNQGFCEGNNIGIRQALQDGASHIVILNNDTLVPDASLTNLLSAFKKLPDAGAISPVIMEYPEVEKVWFAEARWDATRAQFRLNPDLASLGELQRKTEWKSEFACGCCMLTSAKILNEVGLLDERYFAYFDEADWCKRLQQHGYISYVTSGALIYHKVSRTTPGLVSTYLMTRNRLLWMKEHLSFRERSRSFFYREKEFFWHLLNRFGLRKGVYSREHSRAYLQGVLDFRLRRFGKWSQSAARIFGMRN